MTVINYVVSFEYPPVPVEGMAYWKRSHAENPGWVCVMADGGYGVEVLDGAAYAVVPTFEYVRRRLDGVLIAVPMPRNAREAAAVAPFIGQLERVAPQYKNILEICERGDALYVLLPSGLWPSFETNKLAQSVYKGNLTPDPLLKGLVGSIHDTPIWSDIYEKEDDQVPDLHVWVVRRNKPETRWSYFVDALNPPPPSEMSLYWERSTIERNGTKVSGWASINHKGDVLKQVLDGAEFSGPMPLHEYALYPEPNGTMLAVLTPRNVHEAFYNGTLHGRMRANSSDMATFFREGKRGDTLYLMVNHALWSDLLHNGMQKKIMSSNFKLSSREEQLHNGFMGWFKNVPVWSDAFCVTDQKIVGQQIWTCYEVPQ